MKGFELAVRSPVAFAATDYVARLNHRMEVQEGPTRPFTPLGEDRGGERESLW
jgi:hypothetical protein